MKKNQKGNGIDILAEKIVIFLSAWFASGLAYEGFQTMNIPLLIAAFLFVLLAGLNMF